MSENLNPFRAPASNVEVTTHPEVLPDASKGQRFGTFVVDYVVFTLCSFAVGAAVGLIFGSDGVRVLKAVPELLWGVLIFFIYYGVFEGIWSRTPGKLVFGTRVITDAGNEPAIGHVVKRTLCRFIPFEAFSFFGEKGWHDSISKTRVVRTRV
jgi:uncharacterized RDD family membrane protein YckC